MKQAGFSLIMSGERELKYNTLLHIATIFQMNVVDIITYPEKYCPEKDTKISADAVLQIRLDGKMKEEFLRSFLGSEIQNILK
ncbi:XRE family transcriptional regulator [Massilibacteroides vaginae]|uniref:XRE family transcriptional regulator n=1 Tax=Massilibacteroides vaginae TaxID=1673718 RepID=UPI001FE60ED4|nr:XRE family transcriptional regulator [Massilibacteroides vaginae]